MKTGFGLARPYVRTLLLAPVLLMSSGCGKLLRIPNEQQPWNEAIGEVTGVKVRAITLAEQQDVLLAHIDQGLHDPLRYPYFLIGVLGCVLWTIAYGLFIQRAIRDKINTLPILAICLNFTWELMAVFVLPNPSVAWTVLEWSWVVLDLVLLALLWMYGANGVKVPELKRHFRLVMPLTLVLCFVAQLTFVLTFGDLLGFIVAFVINLVMSALFIAMFFDRSPHYKGLSYPAAWLKMLGTACTSIQCAELFPAIRPDVPSWGFLYFLYVVIFLLDTTYVALLHRVRPR